MADTTRLPVLDNITTLDQLKEYVYSELKKIKYSLQNIDEDNLSDALISSIKESDGNDELMTSIERTASSINMKASKKQLDKLGNAVKENTASIDLQSNQIAMIVEETSPGVYRMKKAAIILGINEGESTATIQADNIDLCGYVTVNGGLFRIYDGVETTIRNGVEVTPAKGSMEAVNGYFTGGIEASSGKIGGFSINNTSLHTANNALYFGTSTASKTIGGTDRNVNLSVGSKFGVASDGTLYASGAYVSGNIAAQSVDCSGGGNRVVVADGEVSLRVGGTEYGMLSANAGSPMLGGENSVQLGIRSGSIYFYVLNATSSGVTINGNLTVNGNVSAHNI